MHLNENGEDLDKHWFSAHLIYRNLATPFLVILAYDTGMMKKLLTACLDEMRVMASVCTVNSFLNSVLDDLS